MKPLDLWNQVEKIMFSDKYRQYLCIKLRDVRQQNRDHVIFETVDRELIADYIIDYSDKLNLPELVFE